METRNFDLRKHLLEFDDIANDQRRVIYSQRNKFIMDNNLNNSIFQMRRDVLNGIIDENFNCYDDQCEIATRL